MAKQSGLGDNFYIGGFDLSGDLGQLNKISGGPMLQDVTSIKMSGHERLPLLRDSTWQFTTFFDNASGAEHPALKTLPTADVVACYFRGTTLQGSAAAINCKQVDYDPTREANGNLTLKVDLQSNGFGMEWGEMLTAGLRTDTSATIGSFITDTAGTAFGGQAYFQVVSFTGTSVTIDIQSATTSGGSYATTGLTSQAFTGTGAQRVSVSNTTTINQFLKVVTTGTFTSAVFAVVFVRNLSAGQVF